MCNVGKVMLICSVLSSSVVWSKGHTVLGSYSRRVVWSYSHHTICKVF